MVKRYTSPSMVGSLNSENVRCDKEMYCVLLHMVDGINFYAREMRDSERIHTNAAISTVDFEFEGIPSRTSETVIFNSNCIWECDMLNIKRIKTENRPVKVSFSTLSNSPERKQIGALLLPLRGLPILSAPGSSSALQLKLCWHKLICVSHEFRSKKPEVLLLLAIIKKSLLQTTEFKQLMEFSTHKSPRMPPLQSFCRSITANMLHSQANIYVQSLVQLGLLQVGNDPLVDCDIIEVLMQFKMLKNCNKLVRTVHPNKDIDTVTLSFDFVGNVTNHQFKLNELDAYPLDDVVGMRFKSSLHSIRMYLQRIFYLPINMNINGNVIANYRMDFSKLLPSDSYFNTNCRYERNGIFLFDRLGRMASARELKPHMEYTFSVEIKAINSRQLDGCNAGAAQLLQKSSPRNVEQPASVTANKLNTWKGNFANIMASETGSVASINVDEEMYLSEAEASAGGTQDDYNAKSEKSPAHDADNHEAALPPVHHSQAEHVDVELDSDAEIMAMYEAKHKYRKKNCGASQQQSDEGRDPSVASESKPQNEEAPDMHLNVAPAPSEPFIKVAKLEMHASDAMTDSAKVQSMPKAEPTQKKQMPAQLDMNLNKTVAADCVGETNLKVTKLKMDAAAAVQDWEKVQSLLAAEQLEEAEKTATLTESTALSGRTMRKQLSMNAKSSQPRDRGDKCAAIEPAKVQSPQKLQNSAKTGKCERKNKLAVSWQQQGKVIAPPACVGTIVSKPALVRRATAGEETTPKTLGQQQKLPLSAQHELLNELAQPLEAMLAAEKLHMTPRQLPDDAIDLGKAAAEDCSASELAIEDEELVGLSIEDLERNSERFWLELTRQTKAYKRKSNKKTTTRQTCTKQPSNDKRLDNNNQLAKCKPKPKREGKEQAAQQSEFDVSARWVEVNREHAKFLAETEQFIATTCAVRAEPESESEPKPRLPSNAALQLANEQTQWLLKNLQKKYTKAELESEIPDCDGLSRQSKKLHCKQPLKRAAMRKPSDTDLVETANFALSGEHITAHSSLPATEIIWQANDDDSSYAAGIKSKQAAAKKQQQRKPARQAAVDSDQAQPTHMATREKYVHTDTDNTTNDEQCPGVEAAAEEWQLNVRVKAKLADRALEKQPKQSAAAVEAAEHIKNDAVGLKLKDSQQLQMHSFQNELSGQQLDKRDTVDNADKTEQERHQLACAQHGLNIKQVSDLEHQLVGMQNTLLAESQAPTSSSTAVDYEAKFNKLEQHIVHVKAEMEQQFQLFEYRNKEMHAENRKLLDEKSQLKQRIGHMEQQIKQLRSQHVDPADLQQLLLGVQQQNDRLADVSSAKEHYKKQWRRCVNNVHDLKMSMHQDQQDALQNKYLNLKSVLTKDAADFEREYGVFRQAGMPLHLSAAKSKDLRLPLSACYGGAQSKYKTLSGHRAK